MANDIDMWRDIEELEREGKEEQSQELAEIYNNAFIYGDKPKADLLANKYREKYGNIDNYLG